MLYIVHVLIALQQSIRQRLSSDQIYRWFFSNKHLLLSWLIRFFFYVFDLLQWSNIIVPHFQDEGLWIVYAALVWNALGVILWAWWWRFDCFVSLRHFSGRSSFIVVKKQTDVLNWLVPWFSSRYQNIFQQFHRCNIFKCWKLRLERRRSDDRNFCVLPFMNG